MCFNNMMALHGFFVAFRMMETTIGTTFRAPREVLWEWGGHERQRCIISQNMRPLLKHNAQHY
jgi:hypothetical protein